MHDLLQFETVSLTSLPQKVIDFAVTSSESIAVLGPNGAGKTTLLKAIIGERVVVSGTIKLGGTDIKVLSLPDLYRWVAYMPQEAIYPLTFRVNEYLRLALLRGKEGKSLDEIAQRFRLGNFLQRRMENLSSGERQRVHLARVFLQGAKLLLLDEPTNHLDPGARQMFWELLIREQKVQQTATLIVTHDLEFARGCCSKILALGPNGVQYWGGVKEYFNGNLARELFETTAEPLSI